MSMPEPYQRKRITGAVDFLVEGDIQLKSGEEILRIAESTRFDEEGTLQRETNDGDCVITYTPREPLENALPTAVAEGLLLYKFDVRGTPPKNLNLSPGSYYFFIQYINGRWTGFAVDQRGRLACATLGVIFKQVVRIHPGRDHVDRPFLITHKIASSTELDAIGQDLPLAAADDWIEYQHDWRPFGVGCWSDIICIPAT